MNNKVLFLLDQHCDSNPASGLSNNVHNIIGSFKHCGINVPFDVFYYDECFREHGVHVDKLISKVYEKIKPTVAIISLIGKYPGNPSIETFKFLKSKGCKVCIQWQDTGYSDSGWGAQQIEQLNDNLVDLHVAWDNPDSQFHRTWKEPSNFIRLWVPQDDKYFFKDSQQDVPVSFIGSVNTAERNQCISFLMANKVPIMVRGGQRMEQLSHEQYASFIRRSKININFPWCNGSFDQCKGRVYEALACNSLLLERKNNATNQLFVPGKEYIEFENPQDLAQKIIHYLNNEQERATIAENGYKKFQEKYIAKTFWTRIVEDERMR